MIRITHLWAWPGSLALLTAVVFFAGPARADIDLRVESRPLAQPIEAFVGFTDGGGPVTGLTADDFAVTLDGAPLNSFVLDLPPNLDPAQKKSIVFVIDAGTFRFSNSVDEAVANFIDRMRVGDYAAIVKYHNNVNSATNGLIEQPFTQIDGGAGSNTLLDFLADYPRPGEAGLYTALIHAINQFATVPLPNGPKAVIFVSGYLLQFDVHYSASDVVSLANDSGIAIFSVGVGGFAEHPDTTAMFTSFAEETGGKYLTVPDATQVEHAFVTLRRMLDGAYRLTIPQTAVTDCDLHMLGVTALGQSMSAPFARCDTTPDRFAFRDQINVATGALVVSKPVMITGIDSPTAISVINGEYSIGCVSEFRSDPGFILANQEVCVRHTASTSALTSISTGLVVGGLSALFTSTTGPDGGGGGGGGGFGDGGGGGSTGVIELLLALGAFFARRLRRTPVINPVSRAFKCLHSPACILAALVAAPALAAVDLRIESRPMTGPIEAFVRVTAGSETVAGLERGDFAVTLDGRPVARFGFRLPVEQDPAQNLSIVFVLADSRAIESAIPAIEQMPVGAYAAIVRARYDLGDPTPFLRVHPFTRIDGDAGSRSLVEFLDLSVYELAILRYGSRVPHLDWLSVGLDQLETPTAVLPRGPRAVVLVGNGRDVESWSRITQSDNIARANDLGVPVFTIGTQDFRDRPGVTAFMSAVASDTGGRYLRGHTTKLIGKAYGTIQALLGSGYRLVISSARATDCNPHMLEVTVLEETASTSFVRCDTTPEPLHFRTKESVKPESVVVSNAATITGIDGSVEISVYGGSYSLGCHSGFTRARGIALAGDLVCVRHVASAERAALTGTTLVVGGVASSFYSTTRNAP